MKLILNNSITDASLNLALEEYCVRNLDTANNDYLLFYINSPSIIIGKHQNTIEEINREYVEKNNVRVVRRISGGGAVYHDEGNLNFSFITKYAHESIHNFKKFTGPVIKALNELGVDAQLSGRNDIIAGGRKISGNAQFSNTRSMFSHGTLLFNSKLEDVVEALNVKNEKIESKGIKSIRSRVANIKEFIKEDISINDFKKKITECIYDGRIPHTYQLSSKQWSEVEALSNSKYRTWEWNYGRSPEFNIQKVKRFDFGQIDARLHVKDGIIEGIKIYGDFLAHLELDKLEEIIVNNKYEKQSLSEALQNVDLGSLLGPISALEFASFLTE